MTDILKYAIPPPIGSAQPTLERLTEVVNILQGITDQDQRAVRITEFEARMSAVEARLTAAGF